MFHADTQTTVVDLKKRVTYRCVCYHFRRENGLIQSSTKAWSGAVCQVQIYTETKSFTKLTSEIISSPPPTPPWLSLQFYNLSNFCSVFLIFVLSSLHKQCSASFFWLLTHLSIPTLACLVFSWVIRYLLTSSTWLKHVHVCFSHAVPVKSVSSKLSSEITIGVTKYNSGVSLA